MFRRRLTTVAATSVVPLIAAVLSGATLTSARADDAAPDPKPTPTATTSPAPAPSGAAKVQPTGPADARVAASTAVPTPAPPQDNYTPPEGVLFNDPVRYASRYVIRKHVLRTIRTVPTGGDIRIAAYSINDNRTVDALLAAHNRGVSVQAIANQHILRRATYSASFARLKRGLAKAPTWPIAGVSRQSWAKVCQYSCRGVSGNVHQKMYLFSRAGTASGISMVGSANLTLKAAGGQWNHLWTNHDAATYQFYRSVFDEMAADQARADKDVTTSDIRTWVWPRRRTAATDDPMLTALGPIRCKGAVDSGRNGRTLVRIGMYSWKDERGLWLAKKVRGLWNAGCDVAIEYGVIGGSVKKVLYSPAGRGRIPMKQIGTFFRSGKIDKYTHHKFVFVSGVYGSDRSHRITLAGTTNFANLGMYSDEMTQVSHRLMVARAYFNEFKRLWRSKQAKTPSPVSRTSTLRIGAGNLANLDAD